MKNIFTYKDDMIDLSKVSIIETDDNIVTFYMDQDWEYEIEIDEKDIEDVKRRLATQFHDQ